MAPLIAPPPAATASRRPRPHWTTIGHRPCHRLRANAGVSPPHRAANAAPSSSAARCRACSARRSCARSAGTSTSTSARGSNWSAAAPASPTIRNCSTRWRRAAPAPSDLGIEVPKRIAIDRDGRITDERPLRQILTSWDRLQRLLRATIDPAHYHLGWNFERVEQDERGVRVQFSGGRVEDADILVGGDGIRSTRARPDRARACSRSTPAITSGAARRTRPISRRGRCGKSSPTSPSICRRSRR